MLSFVYAFASIGQTQASALVVLALLFQPKLTNITRAQTQDCRAKGWQGSCVETGAASAEKRWFVYGNFLRDRFVLGRSSDQGAFSRRSSLWDSQGRRVSLKKAFCIRPSFRETGGKFLWWTGAWGRRRQFSKRGTPQKKNHVKHVKNT